MNTKTTKKTVFVGLSGGVDSSVSALRLIAAGYDVVGVFIKVWQPEWLTCGWEEERLDAMRVAAHLGIPFLTCDGEAAYKKEVGDFFVSEYLAGRTPNPDVLCNQHVKFGIFMEFALERGADYVATGHYAQNKFDEKSQTYQLLRGNDVEKDQSYFLWTLTQPQLKRILFPVGDSPKSQIRAEAEQARLPVAAKKDSQGVCFLGAIDIPEFMSHFVELKPGLVLDEEGSAIGTHVGSLVYTLGQRQGFTIDSEDANRQPYYLIDKDLNQNTITVSTKRSQLVEKSNLFLTNRNEITGDCVAPGTSLSAQFRYRQKPFPIKYFSDGHIELLTDVERPAPGQSCVLYEGDRCLGGGIIA